MKDLLLSIDAGTQSVRALVFDATGELVAKTRVVLDGYRSPNPGWHEHDAEGFWRAVCAATTSLWAQRPELRERICGMSITTQRATVVNVDADGKPLRPAITWLDQRKSAAIPAVSPFWNLAFAVSGVSGTIRYFQREAEANWLQSCEPETWRNTHKYLLLSGYLIYKCSGRFVDSIGSQVGYIPFDFKRRQWAARGDWKWQALSMRPELLPDLVEPGTRIGEITSQAASDTGVPARTPLIAAAADKACEVLGAGCLDPEIGCLSYGTTAIINVTMKRYLEATPHLPPYPSALPGYYNTEVQIFRGYWMVSWFKEQFGLLERLAAEQANMEPEALFDQLVESVPPGSMGLMLQPYWTPGIRHPGPEAKGAIVGFGDVHTRAHLYRAILEGLAYALRDGKERIERRGRLRIGSLRVSGGGSQSDAAMQVTADIFGLPAARPHVYETSGLGAAMDAAVGLGIHPDFESAVRAMTRIARTFEPNEKTRELYDALYERVYKKMYDRLQPLYREIREITGYPQIEG
ncbi:MAG TPA: FGGY-family carbohydrate kinase [Candidatus Baltobacteraceae bacterium]|nr:FGGY-family carbohydrate kinase [Candidatus Baltobacteraceae bacterium]